MLPRRTILAAIAASALTFGVRIGPATAIDAGQAGSFVQRLGDEAIATLGRSQLDKQARDQEFRRLLKKGFAIQGIGRFVLGRYWRGASDEQRERYQKAFEDFLVATYAVRFEEYRGQTFKVGSERPDGEDGRIVDSQVKPKEGPPIQVQWRVRQAPDGLKIVDVLVEGVSMAVTQRSEFASYIQGSGGDIDGLIRQLEAKAAAMR